MKKNWLIAIVITIVILAIVTLIVFASNFLLDKLMRDNNVIAIALLFLGAGGLLYWSVLEEIKKAEKPPIKVIHINMTFEEFIKKLEEHENKKQDSD